MVLIFLLWLLHGILLPFVVGMAIAYFLDPVAGRLEALGLSRRIAVGLIVLFFTLLGLAVTLLVLPIVLTQTLELLRQMPDYMERARAWLDATAGGRLSPLLGIEPGDFRNALKSAIGPAMQVLGSMWNQGMALVGLGSLLLVTPIVSIYLLLDWHQMVARVDSLVPHRHRAEVRKVFVEIDRTLAGFVRGQGTVCLLLGIFYAVGLSLVGLRFGLLVGLAAGLISFVPYLGAIIGGLAAGLLATLQFWPDHIAIALVVAVFALGQFLEGNFLTPKLIGDRVRLHPVWVMFALFSFGYLFGFVGVLLAVPVAAALGVLTRHGLRHYQESELFLGGDGKP
ncbi:MAG: AI-2E family transporter [Ketobacteraceae bacterium]|nr:AI-2E family transporter [Ketobacteraceae bacterium]